MIQSVPDGQNQVPPWISFLVREAVLLAYKGLLGTPVQFLFLPITWQLLQ